MNVLFDYQYRDADNYKEFGVAVFANPESLSLSEADARLRRCVVDSDNFNARQVGLPDVFPDGFDEDYDHAYHEYCLLEPTKRLPTDPRTLSQFVADFEREAAKGWRIDDDRSGFCSLEFDLLRDRVELGLLSWKQAVALNRARLGELGPKPAPDRRVKPAVDSKAIATGPRTKKAGRRRESRRRRF
jgi:hypothetical protein